MKKRKGTQEKNLEPNLGHWVWHLCSLELGQCVGAPSEQHNGGGSKLPKKSGGRETEREE
jgi:hypothetical protein